MIHMTPTDPGWIEVIAGCMFAGKTEELIRRLRRVEFAKQKVVAVKPAIDDRYHGNHLASHNGVRLVAVSVTRARDVLEMAADAAVVGVDEAQFFDDAIVDVCRALAGDGKRVVVAGLDTDYRGNPFGPMPQLLAVAEFVTKVNAVCTVCGGVATRSQRIVDSQEQVVVGGASAYEARCRRHWSPDPVFAPREAGELDG